MTITAIRPTAPAAVLGDLNYSTVPAGLSHAERHAYDVGYSRGARAYIKKNGGPGVVHNGDAPAAGTPERAALGVTLAQMGREHRTARHPQAHRAGMSALRSYLRKIGATSRLAELVDPCAPGKALNGQKRTPAPVETIPAAKPARKARKPRVLAVVPEAPGAPGAPAFVDCHDCGTRDYPGESHTCEPLEVAEPEIVRHRLDETHTATTADGTPVGVETMTPAHRTRKAARRALADEMRARGENPGDVDAWNAAKTAAGIK